MKIVFEVSTSPESLELEDGISNLLEDNGVAEEVERALEEILERYLGQQGFTVKVALLQN